MKIISILTIIFLIFGLSLGFLFIGSVAGEMFRGNEANFDVPEIMIVVGIFLLSIQISIIFLRRERKNIPISHYLKEARKNTY